jgi:hypothetical protein
VRFFSLCLRLVRVSVRSIGDVLELSSDDVEGTATTDLVRGAGRLSFGVVCSVPALGVFGQSSWTWGVGSGFLDMS